jgi:hypothetical protein
VSSAGAASRRAPAARARSSNRRVADAPARSAALIDARGLGDIGGALVGFVVYELVLHGWHHAMHRVPLLWRTFHQMHHSAERVDVFGAYYFHPLDFVGFSFITSLSLVGILGLTAPAATGAALTLTFCNFFQHAHLRTPRWLGWIVQRPESHAVHHARGVHAWHYSDLPLWNLLFGTLRNPAQCDYPAGFCPAHPTAFALRARRPRSQPLSVRPLRTLARRSTPARRRRVSLPARAGVGSARRETGGARGERTSRS